MLPFSLIPQPGIDSALRQLSPDDGLDLLVMYHGELGLRKFLSRILRAAGYDAPGEQLHLLEWSTEESLDLAGLVRALGVGRVLLFGYELPRLGLHLRVANYQPVTVGGVSYLVADSLEYISQTKEAGDNRAAGALWAGMKQALLREPDR